MQVSYEENAHGETVKVTAHADGTVVRELERPPGPRLGLEAALRDIDAATGMSRSLRESFIAASFASPWLIAQETRAAELRAQLAAL